MKLRLKNFTLRHYLRHVRKQNKHVQHVHAFAFAGIITALIAGFILYTDYGFWHETYRSEDSLVAENPPAEPVSPSTSFSSFFKEAKTRFDNIGSTSADLLEGKESYTKDSQ